jgi:hypothetical protein
MTQRLLWIGVLAVFASAPAFAQSRPGIRVGVSGDPDQFVFGGHVSTGPLINSLTFRPNVEVGVGDARTVLALNFEFAYWIPVEDKAWQVYLGAGPAANITWRDRDGPGRGDGDDGDLAGGLNFMVGLEHDGGLFTEFKVGAIGSPNIKFSVGWVFR